MRVRMTLQVECQPNEVSSFPLHFKYVFKKKVKLKKKNHPQMVGFFLVQCTPGYNFSKLFM